MLMTGVHSMRAAGEKLIWKGRVNVKVADFSPEQLSEISMVDLGYLLLEEERQVFDFYTLAKKVAELKGYTQSDLDERIAQFYTDVNTDGRFINIGNNLWGLKRWYPIEQIDEEMTMPKKKKKKSSKQAKQLVEDDDIYEDETDDLEDDTVDEEEYEEDSESLDELEDDSEDFDDDVVEDDDYDDDDYDEEDEDEDDLDLDEEDEEL